MSPLSFIGCWDPNSSLHIYTASSLPGEPSFESLNSFLEVNSPVSRNSKVNEISNVNSKGLSVIFGLVVTECCQQRETVSYNSSVVADFKSRTIFSCGFQENQKDLNLGNHLRML